jgi:hypothetical protein
MKKGNNKESGSCPRGMGKCSLTGSAKKGKELALQRVRHHRPHDRHEMQSAMKSVEGDNSTGSRFTAVQHVPTAIRNVCQINAGKNSAG